MTPKLTVEHYSFEACVTGGIRERVILGVEPALHSLVNAREFEFHSTPQQSSRLSYRVCALSRNKK